MSTKGLKRYTNGIVNKMFVPGTEPEGFILGVTESYRKHNSESHKGKTAWNKGLTKETDDRVKHYSHPKTEIGRKNISQGIKTAWKNTNYRDNHIKGLNTPECVLSKSKGKRGYKYDDLHFHSLPELIFYIYCVDNDINISRDVKPLEYIVEGKIHHYIPDFIVDGELIEIKGDWLLDNNDQLINPFKNEFHSLINEGKNKCIIDNNVRIIRTSHMKKYKDYVYSKYGEDYLEQFKIIN